MYEEYKANRNTLYTLSLIKKTHQKKLQSGAEITKWRKDYKMAHNKVKKLKIHTQSSIDT